MRFFASPYSDLNEEVGKVKTILSDFLFVLLVANKILWLFADNRDWNCDEVERFQQAVVEYDKDFVKISQHVSVNTALNQKASLEVAPTTLAPKVHDKMTKNIKDLYLSNC